MANTYKIDSIDRKILETLQENAKITNAQLSKEIGLSPAPTLERTKKLEMLGIIESYHAELNTRKIGLTVTTFVQLSLKGHGKHYLEEFTSAIQNIPEIIECHHTTGSGDFLLKIIAVDITAYEKLLTEQISAIPAVESMRTSVVLSTFKDSKSLPLPNEIKI